MTERFELLIPSLLLEWHTLLKELMSILYKYCCSLMAARSTHTYTYQNIRILIYSLKSQLCDIPKKSFKVFDAKTEQKMPNTNDLCERAMRSQFRILI